MKLYLDQFGNKELVKLQLRVSQPAVAEFLDDQQFVGLSDLTFDLKAHRLGSAIQIRGRMVGMFGYECGRCLSERSYDLDEDVDIVYIHRDSWDASGDSDDLELTEEDIDASFYSGDEIDLTDELREVVLLALPDYAICTDDLRQSCDQALAELIAEANLDRERIQKLEEDAIDERWSKLKNLKLQSSDEKN